MHKHELPVGKISRHASGSGERNCIFYQLLLGTASIREKCNLDHVELTAFQGADVICEPYHFLNQSGCTTVGNAHDEATHFEEVDAALRTMKFTDETIINLYRVVASILHLGNIKFEARSDGGHDGSSITSASEVWLNSAADLLGVDASQLRKFHTHERIVAGGNAQSVYFKELNPVAAAASRDATAKSLYSRLFSWIVQRINKAVCLDDPAQASNYIGILDIFGFEIFEKNGFEQLCINFANEKLQQQFNYTTFKRETEIYEKEGVIDRATVDIVVPNNQQLLDIIGGSKGTSILRTIDEEIRIPGGTSEGFFKKVKKEHCKPAGGSRKKREAAMISTKPGKKWFAIQHFAGRVEYTYEGFLETNKDKANETVAEILAASTSPLISELFASVDGPSESGQGERSKGKKKKKAKTVASKFRTDVNGLVKTLNTTRSHYVRCIKSNPKQLRNLDILYALRQLSAQGL